MNVDAVNSVRVRAISALCVAVGVSVLGVSACTVSGSATGESTAAGPGLHSGSGSPTTTAPLPVTPQFTGAGSACAGGSVVGTADITHPAWGPTRIFAVKSTTGSSSTGPACLVAMDAQGVRWSHAEQDSHTEVWKFASPATDSTGNTFVIYNPGRYDGVIVLVPTADGFAPIEPSYQTGANRYYYAELVGPQNGQYAIQAENNNCVPDCAGGTITRRQLHWNGSTYS